MKRTRIESLQGAEVLNRDDIVSRLNGGLGDTLDATPGISTTFLGGRQPADHSRPRRRSRTRADGLTFRPAGEASDWSLRPDGRKLTDEAGRVHSSFLKDEIALPGRNFRFTLLASF